MGGGPVRQPAHFVSRRVQWRRPGESPAWHRLGREAQWKTLRTTNTIERLHEEFRRWVKTQGSLPSEDAAVVLLFSAAVLRQHTTVAA